MPKSIPKSAVKWIVALGALAAVAIGGIWYWKAQQALPKGIAYGNGRIEAKLVDVASKEPLRVKEVLVEEGSLVKPGQLLVKLDTVTLDAQLAEANSNVAAAQQRLEVAKATIVRRKSEVNLASVEVSRS